MIYAFPYQEKDNHPELFDDMFRERHRLYVEGRGWKELGRGDGREIDQFDTSGTIYLMAVDSKGNLLGSIRLNPSTSDHMLDTIFPELCSGKEVPRGIDTWEMSRLFVCHHSEFDEKGVTIKGRLFCAMYEFCLLHDITGITAVCDSYFLPRVLKAGVVAKPLGLPQKYETGEMIGVKMDISSETLTKVQAHYGVPANSLNSSFSLPKPWERGIGHDLPKVRKDIECLNEIGNEAKLLSEIGAIDAREEYIAEFTELVFRLASSNVNEVKKAEKELDELAERIRAQLYGSSGIYGQAPKQLQ